MGPCFSRSARPGVTSCRKSRALSSSMSVAMARQLNRSRSGRPRRAARRSASGAAVALAQEIDLEAVLARRLGTDHVHGLEQRRDLLLEDREVAAHEDLRDEGAAPLQRQLGDAERHPAQLERTRLVGDLHPDGLRRHVARDEIEWPLVQRPDALEGDADRHPALAHRLGEHLQEAAGRRAEVEHCLPRGEEPLALDDLVDLVSRARPQPLGLGLAVVEVLRIVRLRHELPGAPLLPAPSGHYPGGIFPVKRMPPLKALLVASPLVLAGTCGAWYANGRIAALRGELAAVDADGKAEGDSYLRTLQGAHAERHLELLTRRHDVALRLAAARRDRLLGVIAVLGGGLAFAFVRAAQRIAGEVEEGRRLAGGAATGGASPGAPRDRTVP